MCSVNTESAPVCLADFEQLAAAVLPAGIRDYIDGGSGAETTLAANRAALDRVAVVPRMLAGSEVITETRLLRSDASIPVAVAPMAYQRLVHPEGELALAAAAADAGIPYVISTMSSTTIEEIAATGAEVWFQLYWQREHAAVEKLVDRAVDAGCTALMVTVDVPILGSRLRDLRNAFALPPHVLAANLADPAAPVAHASASGTSALATHTSQVFAPGLGWHQIEWLREQIGIPLVVKGILDPRDARLAVDAGADAVVVSNHGGRQLDGAVASVTALPAVIDAVGNDCEVLLDSGIRSGTDVLRALALGASGVLVGRPLLWALAVDSAELALTMLRGEIHDAFTLAGCRDADAVRDLVVSRSPS
jgi:4-hydroxymandelate oxidase